MRNRRNTVRGLLAAAAIFVVFLAGCRAFEPEAVIVNKPPETYIIGAPIEHGGGYFHFHVHWYGSDEDGRVERFVWALTDTTVQDPDTTDDEEDARFNPALDASTLDIANWTTRTDSIFDFRIDQGVRPSADMTLHMVAMDDFGDYDRTPARLHFFSNTLGNPSLQFFRVAVDSITDPANPDTTKFPLPIGAIDTVGFSRKYILAWEGLSPNVRGYADSLLVKVDTVPPFDDGLLGYKWQLGGALGGNCVPTVTDCWRPREFNEASGDSFSYFGDVTSLTFHNDGSDPENPFRQLLPSGPVNLQVNSVDVAGVEVSNFMRSFDFVVNFDPQTIILNDTTDWAHPGEDDERYPYYVLLSEASDPAISPTPHYPFKAGDRIPDRSYVVVKALARDDPRDKPTGGPYQIGITGFVQGARHNLSGGVFRFQTESSLLDEFPEPTWGPGIDGWYADTLGFLVGPRTEYTFNMSAVDEHARRDGSPAQLIFEVGENPGVQCMEVLPSDGSVSTQPRDQIWQVPGDATHPCAGPAVFAVSKTSPTPPDELSFIGNAFFAVDRSTGFPIVVASTGGLDPTSYWFVSARRYRMSILLHGEDDPREAWSEDVNRMMAWRYQVDYECDPFNQIKDGGGVDDINRVTWGDDGTGIEVDPGSGLWRLSVDVAVPSALLDFGPTGYWQLLMFTEAAGDTASADIIYDATMRQLGDGEIQAVALDQTFCGTSPLGRPAAYNYFTNVRPTVASPPPGRNWRYCNLKETGAVPGLAKKLNLSAAAMESNGGEPVTRAFRLFARTTGGDADCTTPPR